MGIKGLKMEIEGPDESQKEAIFASPSLALKIVAGPGTGKTFTLVERFLALTKYFPPERILVLTFTNKAAEEMARRLERKNIPPEKVFSFTFHSFAVHILRDYPLQAGLAPGFRVLEEAEGELLLSKVFAKFKDERAEEIVELFSLLGEEARLVLNEFPRILKRIRLHLLSPKEFEQRYFSPLSRRASFEKKVENKVVGLVASFFRRYEEELEKNHLLDFSGLLTKLYRLLSHQDIKREISSRFSYIMVDEFQDTNIAQFRIIERLSSASLSNVTVVGDHNQSIYGFRDADPGNLTTRFPVEARKVMLGINYRSYQPIIDLASKVIEKEIKETPPQLRAKDRGGKLYPLGVYLAKDREEEAEFIARKIKELIGKPLSSPNKRLGKKPGDPISFGDFAILLRAMKPRKRIIPYEEALLRYDIPFTLGGGGGFLQSDEVSLLISLLKLIETPEDELSFFSLLTHPVVDLPDKALLKLRFLREFSPETSLFPDILKNERMFSLLNDEELDRLKRLRLFLLEMEKEKPFLSISSLVSRVIERSGFLKYLRQGGGLRDRLRQENVRRFHRFAKEFEERNIFPSLSDFIDYVETIREMGLDEGELEEREEDAVSILTVHKAKGLEFPIVFVSDFSTPSSKEFRHKPLYFDEEYGVVVRGKNKDKFKKFKEFDEKKEPKSKELKEEWRIRYVAFTRAEELLIITTNAEDKLQGFLQEWFEREKDKVLLSMPPKPAIPLPPSPSSLTKDEERRLIERLELLFPPHSVEVKGDQPIRLSFTSLSTYLACPRRYYLSYVARLPEERKEEKLGLLLGSLVHRALFEYHRGRRDSLFSLFKKEVKVALGKRKGEKKLLAMGRRLLKNYLVHPVSRDNPSLLEQAFTLHLVDDDGDVFFSGVLDRVDLKDGKAFLIDYKTDAKVDKELLNRYRLQLFLYLLAMWRGALGKEFSSPEGAGCFFLSSGKLVSFPFTEKGVLSVEELILSTARRIRKGEFPERTGVHCDSCPYRWLDLCVLEG